VLLQYMHVVCIAADAFILGTTRDRSLSASRPILIGSP